MEKNKIFEGWMDVSDCAVDFKENSCSIGLESDGQSISFTTSSWKELSIKSSSKFLVRVFKCEQPVDKSEWLFRLTHISVSEKYKTIEYGFADESQEQHCPYFGIIVSKSSALNDLALGDYVVCEVRNQSSNFVHYVGI